MVCVINNFVLETSPVSSRVVAIQRLYQTTPSKQFHVNWLLCEAERTAGIRQQVVYQLLQGRSL